MSMREYGAHTIARTPLPAHNIYNRSALPYVINIQFCDCPHTIARIYTIARAPLTRDTKYILGLAYKYRHT